MATRWCGHKHSGKVNAFLSILKGSFGLWFVHFNSVPLRCTMYMNYSISIAANGKLTCKYSQMLVSWVLVTINFCLFNAVGLDRNFTSR